MRLLFLLSEIAFESSPVSAVAFLFSGVDFDNPDGIRRNFILLKNKMHVQIVVEIKILRQFLKLGELVVQEKLVHSDVRSQLARNIFRRIFRLAIFLAANFAQTVDGKPFARIRIKIQRALERRRVRRLLKINKFSQHNAQNAAGMIAGNFKIHAHIANPNVKFLRLLLHGVDETLDFRANDAVDFGVDFGLVGDNHGIVEIAVTEVAGGIDLRGAGNVRQQKKRGGDNKFLHKNSSLLGERFENGADFTHVVGRKVAVIGQAQNFVGDFVGNRQILTRKILLGERFEDGADFTHIVGHKVAIIRQAQNFVGDFVRNRQILSPRRIQLPVACVLAAQRMKIFPRENVVVPERVVNFVARPAENFPVNANHVVLIIQLDILGAFRHKLKPSDAAKFLLVNFVNRPPLEPLALDVAQHNPANRRANFVELAVNPGHDNFVLVFDTEIFQQVDTRL